MIQKCHSITNLLTRAPRGSISFHFSKSPLWDWTSLSNVLIGISTLTVLDTMLPACCAIVNCTQIKSNIVIVKGNSSFLNEIAVLVKRTQWKIWKFSESVCSALFLISSYKGGFNKWKRLHVSVSVHIVATTVRFVTRNRPDVLSSLARSKKKTKKCLIARHRFRLSARNQCQRLAFF